MKRKKKNQQKSFFFLQKRNFDHTKHTRYIVYSIILLYMYMYVCVHMAMHMCNLQFHVMKNLIKVSFQTLELLEMVHFYIMSPVET